MQGPQLQMLLEKPSYLWGGGRWRAWRGVRCREDTQTWTRWKMMQVYGPFPADHQGTLCNSWPGQSRVQLWEVPTSPCPTGPCGGPGAALRLSSGLCSPGTTAHRIGNPGQNVSCRIKHWNATLKTTQGFYFQSHILLVTAGEIIFHNMKRETVPIFYHQTN